MKVLVVGANRIKCKSEELMYTLCVAKNSGTMFGKATEEIYIKDSSPLYNTLDKLGPVQNLVGYYFNIDRNNKGFLENLEVLEKVEDSVIWGF